MGKPTLYWRKLNINKHTYIKLDRCKLYFTLQNKHTKLTVNGLGESLAEPRGTNKDTNQVPRGSAKLSPEPTYSLT